MNYMIHLNGENSQICNRNEKESSFSISSEVDCCRCILILDIVCIVCLFNNLMYCYGTFL